jgi:hypothetical protein
MIGNRSLPWKENHLCLGRGGGWEVLRENGTAIGSWVCSARWWPAHQGRQTGRTGNEISFVRNGPEANVGEHTRTKRMRDLLVENPHPFKSRLTHISRPRCVGPNRAVNFLSRLWEHTSRKVWLLFKMGDDRHDLATLAVGN